ncbi:hypothetical protein [Subtercola sp. YIM 133946]|uniref:hypothetical protein n=1 Tax=Subtercola sp. YIM 133946 TaxID=3118909 RepID=UPI002F92F9C4
MLPETINGLPLHILLVHVVVIVVPAGALLTAVGSVWPAFRRKLGILTPIVTLIGLISVPLATNAGEWLEQRVAPTPLVQAHVALGDTLLPWAIAQFVLATVIWAWYRFFAAVPVVPEAPQRNASVPAFAGAAPAGDPAVVGGGSPADVSATGITPARVSAGGGSTTLDPVLGAAPASASSAGNTASAAAYTGRATRRRASRPVSVVVSIVLIVAGIGVSAGTVAKIVQIGESGSAAVWTGSFSDAPLN